MRPLYLVRTADVSSFCFFICLFLLLRFYLIKNYKEVEQKDEPLPKRGFVRAAAPHPRPASYSATTWGVLPASRNAPMPLAGPLSTKVPYCAGWC